MRPDLRPHRLFWGREVRAPRCGNIETRLPQSMTLFLGVDGGQSGTAAVIGDSEGRVLGTGEAGPCNHAAAGEGRRKLERAVRESVATACRHAALDPESVEFEAACFGMSGGPEDKRGILASILRAKTLVVTNDAVIA